MTRATTIVRALRPRQWVKNVLLGAAPAAAGTLDQMDVAGTTLAGMLVFVAASGATYLGNDVADVTVDRLHPTRRRRPVASGDLPVRSAVALSMALAAASLVVAALLEPAFAGIIAVYLVVNLWYSAGMKRIAWLELAAVSSGFILRAVGGGTVTSTPLSIAFVVVVCAVSLVVVAGKRSAELIRTDGVDARRVLEHYSVSSLRTVRVVAAAIAVVAYAVWVLVQDVTDDGTATGLAALSLVPFTASIAVYERALDRGLGEDPEEILLRDRTLQILVAVWCLAYGTAVNV